MNDALEALKSATFAVYDTMVPQKDFIAEDELGELLALGTILADKVKAIKKVADEKAEEIARLIKEEHRIAAEPPSPVLADAEGHPITEPPVAMQEK